MHCIQISGQGAAAVPNNPLEPKIKHFRKKISNVFPNEGPSTEGWGNGVSPQDGYFNVEPGSTRIGLKIIFNTKPERDW